MIPFLNHTDAQPSTHGFEHASRQHHALFLKLLLLQQALREAARYSGRLVIAEEAGTVTAVSADKIKNQK